MRTETTEPHEEHDYEYLQKWTERFNEEASQRLTPEYRQIEDLTSAYTHLDTLLSSSNYEFGEETIKDFHKILSENIPGIGSYAGKYYTAPRRIISAIPWVIKPFVLGNEKLPAMKQLGSDYGEYMKQRITKTEDISQIIDSAADTLTRLEDIHPFLDGNGRTGRLLADSIFLRAGLHQVPFWIRPEIDTVSDEKLKFLRIVEDSRLGDSRGLKQLFVREQKRAIEEKIHALSTDPRTSNLPATRTAIEKQSEYLQYLNTLSTTE